MGTSKVQAASTAPDEIKRTRLTQFRLCALAVILALATVAGISVWRMRSLDDLPDVGDPFDVALALRPIPIPDEDNAFVSFIEARRRLTTFTSAISRLDWRRMTWSKAIT